MKTAELLENTGHPRSLYRGSQSGDGRDLRLAHNALFGLLFPDRKLPAIGDCYAVRRHLGAYADFEVLCRRFEAPHYAWLLRDGNKRSESALMHGFPRDDSATPEGVPMRMFRIEADEAWFVAVYQCGLAPPPAARIMLTPGELGTWTVTVEINDRRFDHRVPQLASQKF